MSFPPLEDFIKNCRKVYATTYNENKLSPEDDAWKQMREPLMFIKTPSEFVTEGYPIVIPHNYVLVEEIRLGAVIGKTCKKVSVEDALDYVGGYCLAFDMTAASEWRKAAPQGAPWAKVKSFDKSCAVSGFIPKSVISDPSNVEMFTTINDDPPQTGNTNGWVFSLAQLINFISRYHTLEPNDVVFGGTGPSPSVIKAGDILKGGIKGGVTIEFCVEAEQ
ncbi:hypothetical protein RI129_009422 [Pyrocoelia pectoralis]|uniref:oxaloacetate tautomerase n=1 Tax=Pyrocoelia pectoralis TaxID=417401 RepID=A0AAN7V1V2_9COLE